MQASLKKGKGHNRLTDLHFSTSLSIEESANLIASLANDIYAVELIETSPHSFKFTLNTILNKTDEGKIEGTLSRWNHNETRVDCSGNVVTKKAAYWHYLPLILFILLTAIFLLMPIFPLDCQYGCESQLLNFAYRGFMTLLSLTGLAFLASTGVLIASKFLDFSRKKRVRQINFRNRDRLFQLLIDSFQSRSDVQAL